MRLICIEYKFNFSLKIMIFLIYDTYIKMTVSLFVFFNIVIQKAKKQTNVIWYLIFKEALDNRKINGHFKYRLLSS